MQPGCLRVRKAKGLTVNACYSIYNDLFCVPEAWAVPDDRNSPASVHPVRPYRKVGTLTVSIEQFADDFALRFDSYQTFMTRRVREILLVSSLYDACIINEDCRLADRIAHEYQDLKLSNPPHVTWAATAEAALKCLDTKDFDLVITMYRLADMDAFALGREVKKRSEHLPVVLLTHDSQIPAECTPGARPADGVDRVFVWSGDSELLVSIIKSVEDLLNAKADTGKGGVRIILLVEGSPARLSRILPMLYRQIMVQTQATIEEGLNEEHRRLQRSARTKVLIADTLEAAEDIYRNYKSYLLGVISEKALMRSCRLDPDAGLSLLKRIREEDSNLPFLLVDKGAELDTRNAVESGSASILDLETESVPGYLWHYLQRHLGFGDFVFRMKDGREIGRAATVQELETLIPDIPDESIYFHCSKHDFSRWLYARSEFFLADRLRGLSTRDFAEQPAAMRTFLSEAIHARRTSRQKGVVADFRADAFDAELEFVKIGSDSMGGKARGLAFLALQLRQNPDFHDRFKDVRIFVPKTLVLATDVFDAFVDNGDLRVYSRTSLSDDDIAVRFLKSKLPEDAARALRAYIRKVSWPLAVRSSSLLEDSQSHPYAGIYRTYMLPNSDPDPEERFRQLADAIKLVYASTFFQEPRAFARRTGRRPDEEKMAVVVQRMVGERYGDLFYPAVSGVAHSYNYYPIAPMTPEDGIANIAMGLGFTVVGGERSLRFCPRYPRNLPQFSTVEDILANAQRFFYGMKMTRSKVVLNTFAEATLEKREIVDIEDRRVLERVAGSYLPEEHRVKDALVPGGHPVVTFARILKHQSVPLAGMLADMLELGEKGMGCPVDMEFSLNFPTEAGEKPELALLQIRPMAARKELVSVVIKETEIREAICYSTHALGNGITEGISDIVFVKPEDFDPSRTADIGREIGRINARLIKEGRQYLLVGPGRWGSQDPWLGIPVQWVDISGTAVIVETTHESFRPDPSQGSHFFHNLTSLNMAYFSILDEGEDRIRWDWMKAQPVQKVTRFLSHVRLERMLTIKVDGKTSRGVILG